MSLERFCRKEIAVVGTDASVGDAARIMRERHVGAVVVVDAQGRPVGILTDRDIACRVVAENRRLDVPVPLVMSRDLVTVRRTDTIDQVAFSMREHGIRRVPILDAEGSLAGLVSLDDLIVLLSTELFQTVAAVRANRGP